MENIFEELSGQNQDKIAYVVSWKANQRFILAELAEIALPEIKDFSRKAEKMRLQIATRRATVELRKLIKDRSWKVDLEGIPYQNLNLVVKNVKNKVIEPLAKLEFDTEARRYTIDRNYYGGPQSTNGQFAFEVFFHEINKQRQYYHSTVVLLAMRKHLDTFRIVPFRFWGGTYLVPPSKGEAFFQKTEQLRQLLSVEFFSATLSNERRNNDLVLKSIREYVVSLIKSVKNGLEDNKLNQDRLKNIEKRLNSLKHDFLIASEIINIYLKKLQNQRIPSLFE